MKKPLLVLVTVILAATALLAGCSGAATTTATTTTPTTSVSNTIVVGSKVDTEGPLLGQMMILMLDANGYNAVDKTETGATNIVKAALESGEIDMYPEYTGNGAFFFNDQNDPVWNNAQQGYEKVKQLDKEQNNIDWLAPAPANNTWAIAVPKALADQNHLVSLDDFAAYVNGGGYVKLIGSEEFITSPVALPKFEEVYGFTLSGDQLLSVSGGNTAQTEQAAYQGTSGVNAAMAYGTDGSLSAYNLVILSDPKGAQPVYEPAPRVRGEIMAAHPDIAGILNPVFESLTLTTLQTLNGKIVVDGLNPKDVARDYLTSKGFLK